MRLGIFGGTFNPVHLGHLRTAEEVRYAFGLDKVIFVPSGNPPLKECGEVAASHRHAMVVAAAASNKNFIVSDTEVRKRGKSYTVDTLQAFHREYAGHELFFILGIDAFAEIPKWRQPEKLIGFADFIVVARAGVSLDAVGNSPYVVNAPDVHFPSRSGGEEVIRCWGLRGGRRVFFAQVTQLDISSTAIRDLVGRKKSIRYLVPRSVENYIKKHKLYSD